MAQCRDVSMTIGRASRQGRDTIKAHNKRYQSMSYVSTLYHIVLRTHRSELAIAEEHENELYAYMNGIINSYNGKLYRIGGMPDHVHLLVSLPATLALASFVKELKVSSSKWMKANPHFPKFTGWSQEYAGFTYSIHDRDKIINYIKGQKEHHKKMTLAEEYRRFIEANEVAIDNRFFMKDA